MHRCLQLAALGKGKVAPNPLVGAVLVHENKIIGEGYHKEYGGAHAEVNCINAVVLNKKHLIPASTLYVSLEPCAHFGKTPPCADLIIKNNIQKVVVGCRDPFHEVNGKGIEKMIAAGIEVQSGILEKECVAINKKFFLFHTLHRPYIILKWSETADHFIAHESSVMSRLLISNDLTNRLVHKWRGGVMSIMVGKRTALLDDPALNTRLWPGKDPVRLVLDPDCSLPTYLKIFDGATPAIVFNYGKHSIADLKNGWKSSQVHYYQIGRDSDMPSQVIHALYQMGIQSVLIEGGAQLLQSFINEGLYDEAIVIRNTALTIGKGLPSPVLSNHLLMNTETINKDLIQYYKNNNVTS